MDAPTIPALLRARAVSTPASSAYVDLDARSSSVSVTWSEFWSRVERLATALSGLGLKPGDRVAIFGPNSIDWETAQHASFACGALVAGIDPNYPPDQLREVMDRLRPTVVLAEDASFIEKLEATSSVPHGLAVVFRRGAGASSPHALQMDELPTSASPGELDLDRIDVSAGGIITFSSGTTGKPKPITFTHAQAREAISTIAAAFPDIGHGERLLCWLPLANLFQRMINFCAIEVGATTYVTGDPRTVMNHLGRIKPRVIIGVPRFFERVQSGIEGNLCRAVWPVRQLAKWALSCGRRRAAASRAGVSLRFADRLTALAADLLVLRRLRKVFGGHVEYPISGSAPMPRWLLEWFDAIGLAVYEAYGVSEDIVPIAMNRPDQQRLGTVGKPLPGVEVKLAPDGEILVRGTGLFVGYLEQEGDAPQPDADGFWATGDLGSFDQDGFLSVRGRKSDTFKTSTGRWISPARVEERLRRLPYIEHATIVGANRKVPIALVCLKTGLARERSSVLAAPAQAGAAGDGSLAAIEATLSGDLPRTLDSCPHHEQPAAVLILRTPFSVDGGELTTNLKLRRAEVERKYATAIETVYRRLDQSSVRAEAGSQGLIVHIA